LDDICGKLSKIDEFDKHTDYDNNFIRELDIIDDEWLDVNNSIE